MSLLDQASLVLTPNAVKEQKLYSIIPNTRDGDMNVVRATTATRVNELGFIEDSPYNLLSYSEEFENSYWTKASSTITANQGIAPNGTNTMDLLSFTTSTSSVYQTITLNLGTSYTFSVWLRTQSGTETIRIGNISAGNYINVTVTTTLTRFEVTQVASASMRLPVIGSTSICNILAWGAQLVQGSTPKDYFQTTNRLNVPRLNYDTAGGCPSILLEPQRTNIVTYSEDFSNGWSIEGLSIAINSVNSPSNVLNADTITESAITDVHRIYRAPISIITGTTYTYSVYVKKDTQRYFRLVINNSSITTSWVAAQFDLDTITYTNGVGSTNGTFVSASITPMQNGWYRCSIVGSITASNAYAFIALSNGTAIVNTDNRGCLTYLGSVSNKLNLWGAQLEQGAYPTSYIPTIASTVTRNADIISRSNIYTNGLITSAGGTWYVELNNNFSLTRDNVTYFTLTNDTIPTNSFRFFTTSSPNTRSVIAKFVDGTSTNLYTTTTDTIKAAIKWNGTTADIFVNGVKVVTGTAFTATNMQTLNLNAQDVPKYIKSMMLFPTPLSDGELAQLTFHI